MSTSMRRGAFWLAALAIGTLLFGRPAAMRVGPGRQRPEAGMSDKIDVRTLGPQVGAAVPDFDLPDQHDQRRTLQSILAPNGAVLVFFRSADW